MVANGPDYCDWNLLSRETGISTAVARRLVRVKGVEAIRVRGRIVSINKTDFLDKCACELAFPASNDWLTNREAIKQSGISAAMLHYFATKGKLVKSIHRGVAYWSRVEFQRFLEARSAEVRRSQTKKLPDGCVTRMVAARLTGLSERWLDIQAKSVPEAIVHDGHRTYWRIQALPKRIRQYSASTRARLGAAPQEVELTTTPNIHY